MLPEHWTAASIKTHQSVLSARVNELIPLKDSALKEAYARGLGFRTEAAMKAALKVTPELSARRFNDSEFIGRIAELADDASAEVVAGILDGVSLNISVQKRSEQRQRAEHHSDIAYDVEVTLSGMTPTALDDAIVFHLPEFGRDAGVEPYRVDSAHDFRAVTDYRKTRFGSGQSSLVSKLVAGRWYGGFYVYAPEHQRDDANCIRSLKAAIARAVMPQVPTRVRCSIFRPDGYDWGAWRVEMRLPEDLQRFWGGSPVPFDVPRLSHRLFIIPSGFRTGPSSGQFVNGIWMADLYSNGIEEARNPTSRAEVKRALLDGVHQLFRAAGYQNEGKMTPVFDDAGTVVGTVEFRNGLHEAWSRVRTGIPAGNAHKFLGRFANFSDSVSAIRTNR